VQSILQEHLEKTAADLAPYQRGEVLQVALQKLQVPVVRTLIDFKVEPMINLDVLFVQKYNHFNIMDKHYSAAELELKAHPSFSVCSMHREACMRAPPQSSSKRRLQSTCLH
jgi:hypothetical protein